MRRSYLCTAFAFALLATPLLGGGKPSPDPNDYVFVLGEGEPPPAQKEYVFVPGMKGPVALLHQGNVIPGWVDSVGTFTPDPKYPPWKAGQSTTGRFFRIINAPAGLAYEYRSARLILGELDFEGNFAPILGSKVVAFDGYQPRPGAPPIYNLPGKFVKKGEEKEKDKEEEQARTEAMTPAGLVFRRPPAFAPFVPVATTLLGAGERAPSPAERKSPAEQTEYVFVPGKRGPVAMLHDSRITAGWLDAAGTFSPDPKSSPWKAGQAKDGIVIPVLNAVPGPAREYRCGRLILGEIDNKGNFVPTLDSMVFSFDGRQPRPGAPPIYNLPGRFVKKEKKKDNDKP